MDGGRGRHSCVKGNSKLSYVIMNDAYNIKKISECDTHIREIIKKKYDDVNQIYIILNKDVTNQTLFLSYTCGIFPLEQYLILHHHLIKPETNVYTVVSETIKILNFLQRQYPKKNLLTRHTIHNWKSMFMLKRLGFITISRNMEDVPNITLGYHDKKINVGGYKSNLKTSNYLSSFHYDCLFKWVGVNPLLFDKKSKSDPILKHIKSNSVLWVKEGCKTRIILYDDSRQEAFIILCNLSNVDIDECSAAIRKLRCKRILTTNNEVVIEDFLFLCGYVKEGYIIHDNKDRVLIFRQNF